MALLQATNGKCPRSLERDLAFQPECIFDGVIARNSAYQNFQQLTYTPNQKMVCLMPQQMIDFRNSWIEFTITGNPGTYTGCAMIPDIRSIFQRITVLFGSKTVIDVNNYAWLQNAFDYLLDPQWAGNNGQILVGTGNLASRQADFLNATRVYACSLRGFPGASVLFDKVLPLQKIAAQLELDIYLAPASQVISGTVVGVTLPTYTVNNVQFHFDYITPSAELNNLYDTKVNMNPPITYTYKTWENLTDSSTLAAGTSNFSKVLTFKYSSLLGILTLMQANTVLNDFTNDSKMLAMNNNSMNQLRLRIASISYPLDITAPYSDTFTRLLQMFGIQQEKPIAAAANWTTTSFLAACPLILNPYTNKNAGCDDGGLNTAIATSLIFEGGFSTPLATAQTMYIYALTEQVLTFLSNGGVTWNA